jgi:nicotinamidase/pyrazinamidase
MKKVLIIVDPQNDFISGSLAIDGASEKMKSLSSYLKQNRQKYDSILVTMDSHPANHCSFKENGGIWVTHCVKNTDGWFIEPDLAKTLTEFKHVEIFNKGTNSDKEEYSIITNEDDGMKFLKILYGYNENGKLHIDICGIAGDYCVLETLKGLDLKFDNITVLIDYVVSIDGGKKLKEYVSTRENIKIENY